MMKKLIILGFAVLLLAGLGYSTEKTKWFNIHVTELKDQTNVDVHLPLSLIYTAIESIKTKDFHDGKISLHLENTEVDIPKLIQEIKKSPDAEYVKVNSKDADVSISKKGGTITINVTGKNQDKEKVMVKIPSAILDGITVDANNELDVKSLLKNIENLPADDLVSVSGDDANVRIWVE
jgi:hypothetical protein